MSTSPITTHVLDTALGRPAAGVPIVLHRVADDGTQHEVGRGTTNDDGRITDLLEPGSLQAATYAMTFVTERYFAATNREGFYPHVTVVFRITAPQQHYHIPLLLSPYGYSTYRGS